MNYQSTLRSVNDGNANGTIETNSGIQPVQQINPVPIDSFTQQTQVNNQNNETQSINSQNLSNNSNMNKKTLNKKRLFIIGGALLILVSLIVFVVIKLLGNPISVLERSLAKFKYLDSATITASLSLKDSSDNSINLSADMKFQKAKDDYNFEIAVNKTPFSDEFNLYSVINKKKATVYFQSSIMNLLDTTKSSSNEWLYYSTEIDDIIEEKTKEDFNLKEYIDANHFKYVDSKKGLKHYQLTVDKDLIKNIYDKLEEEEIEEFDMKELEDSEIFKETYLVDFYINRSDKLEKISFDLTDSMDNSDYKSVIFSIEFTKLNETKVEIPKAALNSSIDVDSYTDLYNTSDDSYSTESIY